MIDEIDWEMLEHAYGPAIDTPAHLRALTSADAEARDAATFHLIAAVLHQGFPASATAPAARIVTRMLAQDAVAPEIHRNLVEFLGCVAIATGYAQGDRSPFAELRSALEDVVQESYPVVMRFLDAPDTPMRINAAHAVLSYVELDMFAEQRPVLAGRLLAWTQEQPEHRALWVRILGEVGDYTRDFLTDPDPHVRTSAALAPALADHHLATEILVEALFHAVDHGVVDRYIYGLNTLVCGVVPRIDDLQRLAAPAIKMARSGRSLDGYPEIGTWGPLLLAIFQPPYVEGAKLSDLQRHFLAALTENSQIWDYKDGSLELHFRKTGLPFQREACARIAGGGLS